MTEKLFDKDSFIKEFTATVLECEDFHEKFAVLLDKTAFFPEAGGQKSDKGTLDNAFVSDVQIKDEKIYHIVDSPLPVGAAVTGFIDWERRFDFMQQHTAEHIVSGIAHSLFGCENVGFHLSEDIVTLDFDKFLTPEELLKIEKLANKRVIENVGINSFYPDNKTLESLDYRSKKELEGAIRIVEIENTDMCACCAPHVKTAGQIGVIKLLDTEKLRGGIRIELKAGSRALDDYNEKYANVKKISSLLAVMQNETAEGVGRLLKNLSEQKGEITQLKLENMRLKVKSLKIERKITAHFEENLTVKDLQGFADLLFTTYGGIRAVFSENGGGFAFSICGEADRLNEFFSRFKQELDVKGGGRNTMVSGNVTAKKQEIEEFFKG